jgi:hypothetical protein
MRNAASVRPASVSFGVSSGSPRPVGRKPVTRMILAAAWLIALIGLLPVVASAQTATFRLGWTQTEALPIVQGYQYFLKVDALPAVPVTQTCAVSGSVTACSAPLPALASGTHTLVLTAFSGSGSSASDPLVTSPPTKPTTLTITVTVTIP